MIGIGIVRRISGINASLVNLWTSQSADVIGSSIDTTGKNSLIIQVTANSSPNGRLQVQGMVSNTTSMVNLPVQNIQSNKSIGFEITESGIYRADITGYKYIRFALVNNTTGSYNLSYSLSPNSIKIDVPGQNQYSTTVDYSFPSTTVTLSKKVNHISIKNLSRYSVVDAEINNIPYRLQQGEAINLTVLSTNTLVLRPVAGTGRALVCYGDNPVQLSSDNTERLAELEQFSDNQILYVMDKVILKKNSSGQILFSLDTGVTWSNAITLTGIDNTFTFSGFILQNGNCLVCCEKGTAPDTTNRKTFHINTSTSAVTAVQFYKADGTTPIEDDKQSGGWFVSGIAEKPWLDFGAAQNAIIMGNYTTNGADDATRTDPVRLYRSTDGGLTFKVVFDWDDNTLNPNNYLIRHIHTVKWVFGNTWWAFTGDNNNESYWYKSTDDGATWTRVCGGSQRYRLIGIHFLSDNKTVIWGCDSDNPGTDNADGNGIYKCAIADLADPTKHQLLLSTQAEVWGLEAFGNTLLTWTVGIRGNIYLSNDLGQTWKPLTNWAKKTSTTSKRYGYSYGYGIDRFNFIYLRTHNLDETARILKIKI